MATAMTMAHATAICFGEPSISFGFGHRFGSKTCLAESLCLLHLDQSRHHCGMPPATGSGGIPITLQASPFLPYRTYHASEAVLPSEHLAKPSAVYRRIDAQRTEPTGPAIQRAPADRADDGPL